MLRINMELKKEILFIRLKGNLNEFTTPRFLEYSIPYTKKNRVKYIVFNLNELEHIDTSGIQGIIKLKQQVYKNSGKVLVINNTVRYIDNISNELMAINLSV